MRLISSVTKFVSSRRQVNSGSNVELRKGQSWCWDGDGEDWDGEDGDREDGGRHLGVVVPDRNDGLGDWMREWVNGGHESGGNDGGGGGGGGDGGGGASSFAAS
mmetsp:Transcript_26601/g.48843  ORF Transcript_26601/g.48843 Transcript_26601/m.48843 type:complete len:104 (+) Transcript_26601:1769-2080(+)